MPMYVYIMLVSKVQELHTRSVARPYIGVELTCCD